MKRLSSLFVLIIFLSSCEKETTVDYLIDNQSSSAVRVSGENIIASSDIEKTINPGEIKDVAAWSKRGKETDFFEPTSMFGEDLLITNVAGDTLTKDYKLLSSWTSELDDQRTVAIHEYVLVILDSDF